MPATIPAIVFIGGGPRTAGVLERIAANRPDVFPGPLQVHVVEPHIPGSGRIWRYDQDPGLLLNSMAADITMFTDGSVDCEGPAGPGPGLAEWAAGVLDASIIDVPDFPQPLWDQLRSLTGTTFPTRQLQSQYLEWFFRRAAKSLDRSVTVHRTTAVGITEPAGGGHDVELGNGRTLHADIVVTALGHTDSRPDAESAGFSDFAARHGGYHAAPGYTTDVDYSPIAAGQDVIVAGMGLAFVDLLVLLMEGRGGRFQETSDGGLRYLPSGREPRLWAGSRRGVPYHSKISAVLRGQAPGPLQIFTKATVDSLLQQHGELDFRRHLWPLIAKEAGYYYYRELLTGSPERAAMGWDEFAPRYAELDWYSSGRASLVAAAVPDPALHLDLERLDRPFDGLTFAEHQDVQDAVAGYIERDLALRDSPDHPETLALFLALLHVYMEVGRVVPPERLNARSQQVVHGWWHGFFSFVDSGPPPHRLRQMLALHRAGLLQFLGPGLNVTADETTGLFVASSPQSGVSVAATALIEARLPSTSVARSLNPVLASLHGSGLGTEQQLLTSDGIHSTGKLLVSARHQLVDSDGNPQPTLFGVGPGTSGWGAGAFARPHTNAAPFRENDALARTILGAARDLSHASAPIPSNPVTSEPATPEPAAVGKN
ncbi:FAD/NAD(P)-binding protein [Arthrobacter sp. SLBN-112]|uniref:FAD/NAD(P)-binding protein n=1 Tax=Arthrobacter sp. SLBN-112 TaxID=2768452 RepID=UPI0027B5B221|nr:FAD/NAD(P)-binding protein [Arthrobacter sp. SLBN-112]MDQ0799353.1 putative NAD(P)/FAD-binding protein YdhS [Arthrobacter sp. SLBN-112]